MDHAVCALLCCRAPAPAVVDAALWLSRRDLEDREVGIVLGTSDAVIQEPSHTTLTAPACGRVQLGALSVLSAGRDWSYAMRWRPVKSRSPVYKCGRYNLDGSRDPEGAYGEILRSVGIRRRFRGESKVYGDPISERAERRRLLDKDTSKLYLDIFMGALDAGEILVTMGCEDVLGAALDVYGLGGLKTIMSPRDIYGALLPHDGKGNALEILSKRAVRGHNISRLLAMAVVEGGGWYSQLAEPSMVEPIGFLLIGEFGRITDECFRRLATFVGEITRSRGSNLSAVKRALDLLLPINAGGTRVLYAKKPAFVEYAILYASLEAGSSVFVTTIVDLFGGGKVGGGGAPGLLDPAHTDEFVRLMRRRKADWAGERAILDLLESYSDADLKRVLLKGLVALDDDTFFRRNIGHLAERLGGLQLKELGSYGKRGLSGILPALIGGVRGLTIELPPQERAAVLAAYAVYRNIEGGWRAYRTGGLEEAMEATRVDVRVMARWFNTSYTDLRGELDILIRGVA